MRAWTIILTRTRTVARYPVIHSQGCAAARHLPACACLPASCGFACALILRCAVGRRFPPAWLPVLFRFSRSLAAINGGEPQESTAECDTVVGQGRGVMQRVDEAQYMILPSHYVDLPVSREAMYGTGTVHALPFMPPCQQVDLQIS